MATRIPPHDLAAEQAVLGAILLAPDTVEALADLVEAGDFYKPAHSLLWTVLVERWQAGLPVDPVAVAAHLNDSGELGRLGGAPYLHTLIAAVPTTANATYYARIMADHSQQRRVIDFGSRLAQAAASGRDTADLLAASRTLLDRGQSWPEPIPLGERGTVPAFPVEVLPKWVAEQVRAVSVFTQTPIDAPGVIALSALSTAAGGRAVVEVRGSWREPVNLFTVVSLPPGSRKSAVFAGITGPLLAAEAALQERMLPVIIEAELQAKVAAKAAERAANAAAASTTQGRNDLLADATAAAMQAHAIAVPAKPRLIADDVTSETAASLLAEQGGRLAVLSPEGGIFATLAGRYSGTPNLEVFLKGHAGDMLRVDRKSRESEHVASPALTLGLAVQPEVLRDIAGMPGFRGKGLLARILYSLPVNTVGSRQPGAPSVPADVAALYESNLMAMVVSLADWTDPAVLVLSPEADARVLAIECEVEPKLAPGAEWSHIVDWASKYTGAIVRLAGLIHLAEHLRDGWGKPITADTIDRAATLGRYFAGHALAAFDDMGADPVVEDARVLLAWIRKNGKGRISKRDLFTGVSRGRFAKATDLDPALTLLETHGYLRAEEQPERQGPGRRPSPAFTVHPALSKPEAKKGRHLKTVNR